MRLTSHDGRMFDAEPDGSFVPGDGHVGGDDDRCDKCGDDWPCESADRLTVWYEDDDRPQDAQELHRLIEVGPVDLDVLGDAARTAFYAPPCVAWVDLDPPDRAAWMAVAAAVLAALPSGAAKEDQT